MIYWDTSCVLKLYTDESDSQRWQTNALEVEDEFVSSVLLETDVAWMKDRSVSVTFTQSRSFSPAKVCICPTPGTITRACAGVLSGS